jgi:hypothetical protein
MDIALSRKSCTIFDNVQNLISRDTVLKTRDKEQFIMRFQIKLLLLFLMLFVLSALLLFAFYNQIRNELTRSIQQDYENIVHSVHYSSSKLNSEKMPDQAFLNELIDSLKRNSKVKEISIISNNKEIIASSNPHKIGKYHELKDQIVVVRETFGKADTSGKHDQFSVTIPIERDKKIVGLVQTKIVVNDIESLIGNLFVKDSIIAIMLLSVIFILFFEAFRRLNKPVALLVAETKKIAEGERYEQIPFSKHDELGNLLVAFNTMAAKIEEQRQIEQKFRELERKALLSETAATLAHEIRNPLNCINLTVDVLIDTSKNENRESDYSLLVNIKKEVQHLNKMVGEFLAMGKPKPLILKEFPLHELVEEVNILIKRQLQEKNIEVLQFIDKSLRVVADKEQLRLVLLNLFLNAGSAIGDNGLIEITAQSNNGEILLNVKDNGCGIRDDDLPKIFEPYFTTRDDGTGLGLALVKRIVEDHGGTITAGNNESRGATFTITLNQMLGNNNGKSIDS